MSTFENGWICKSCWTPNREHDVRCYRCKELSPDYYVVTEPPAARAPRGPRRSVIAPVVAGSRAGVIRSATGLAALVHAVGRTARSALRGAGTAVATSASAAAATGQRLTSSVSRAARSRLAAVQRGIRLVLASMSGTVVRSARLGISAVGAVARTVVHGATVGAATIASAARRGADTSARLVAGARVWVSRTAGRVPRSL